MTKIKKALLSIVCCFAVIFCCAFVFTACTDAEYTSYNITIDKAIQSGWVTVQGDAIAGEEITIVLNPDTGYEIVPGSLKVNGKEVIGNKFIMPEGNVNVTAKFKKINYAVNTGNIEHGTVDIEVSAQEIASGDSTEWGAKITLTPVPEKGYECTGITVLNNGAQVLVTREGNKWSFIMPQGNITINATFEKVTHTLTKQTEHGSFTIPATASYDDTVEVTNITADPGYVFSKIIVNGNTITGTSFKMPDSDTIVTVEFKAIEYTVSKNDVDHARISLSKTKVYYGDTITVSVTPDEGYIVSAIKVNGVAISGNSFVVEGDSVVTVELTAIDYTITVNPSENGSIVPNKTTANVGDQITLTVNPDATYKLGDLIIKNGDSLVARMVDGNTVTFTMPAGNVTISATFAQEGYKINVIYYEGANIVVTPTIATPGTKVYIYDLGADAGYEYGDEFRLFWSGGDLSESLQMEDGPNGEDLAYFIMPNGEVTLDPPCFKKSAHNITKEETTNGSFDLSADSAYEGDYIKITVHPAEGYELDEVYVNGNSRGQNLGFSMEGSDMTVRVTFKKATYTITREGATEHGYFDVQDQAQYGEEVAIIEQNTEAGYEAVFTVMCNGTPVTVTNNKFIMPAGNVTISVSYTLISYTISVDEENIENGSVSVIPTIANMGNEVTITVTPNDGYSLKAISVLYDANNDGSYQTLIPAKTTNENEYVFNMIAYNVKIRAWFGIKSSITANEPTNGTVEITGVTSAFDETFTANATEAFEGDTVTITTTPSAGFVLKSLQVNNGAVATTETSTGVFTFAMPAEAVSVVAEYSVANITLNTGSNGTIRASKLSASAGDEVTITGTPSSGYYLNEVKIEYGSTTIYADITATNVFKFTMPDANVTITPTFGYFTLSALNTNCQVGDNHDKEGTIHGKRGVRINKVTCSQTVYIIPDYMVINGEKLPVLALGKSGLRFDDDANWAQNRVPNSVERIDFSDLGVEQGTISLDDTYGLRYISTNNNKKWIIGYTRYDMSGTLTLPSGIVGIAMGALDDMNYLSKLVCNSDLKYIGKMHNMGSNNETFTITLNEGLLIIDDEAFRNINITTISIPSTVQYIGMNAFQDCSLLSEVKINSNVTLYEKISEYEDAVFGTCQNRRNGTYSCSVTTLVIGKDVTELPESLFNQYNLNSITTVIVESGNTTYRVAFDDVSGKYALYKGADMILSDLTGNAS